MICNFDTELIETIVQTDQVKSFRFVPGTHCTFDAGQYFFLTINVNGEEKTKHFSFSSSPSEKKYLEFTKKITQSDFSGTLNTLKPRTPAKIRMPYGAFTLKKDVKKYAFLSGGIGITPIKSICSYVTAANIDCSVKVIYGNSEEKDIIFRKELDDVSSNNKHIEVFYTLTAKNNSATWNGLTGYIDKHMIEHLMPDFRERLFYICGPPAMVKGLTGILSDELNIEKEKIVTENFNGY